MSSQSKTARNKKIALAVTARHHSERKMAAEKFPDLSVKGAYKQWKHERAAASAKSKD